MTPVVHIVGTPIVLGPLFRQRCCWCGAILEDWDMRQVAVAPGCSGIDPWPVGGLLCVHGHGRTIVRVLPNGPIDIESMPPEWCGAEPVPDNVVRGKFGGPDRG